MLDTAVADGVLTENPVRGSLSISRPAAERPTLSAAEVANVRATVRAWLDEEQPGPRSSGDLADIIKMMLATGAHIGEVLALRWRDLDLNARAAECPRSGDECGRAGPNLRSKRGVAMLSPCSG